MLILQSRPETVWSQRERERVWEPKASIIEHMLDRIMEGRRLLR